MRGTLGILVEAKRRGLVGRVSPLLRKLQEQGIIDSQGRRIRTDRPADMQEGKDRDFGG